MTEAKAMAYVNMYGVLATLENLCEIDEEAKAILADLKSPFLSASRLRTARAARFISLKAAVNSGRARQAVPVK